MLTLIVRKSLVVIAILCCGVVGFSPLSSAQLQPEIRMLPPVVPPVIASPVLRLTGSLHPLSWTADAGVRQVKVVVGQTERMLQLESVETWSDATRSWTMLNDFFPATLYVTGLEDFLGPLQQPEMFGKRITITGRFHAAEQRLALTAAAEDVL